MDPYLENLRAFAEENKKGLIIGAILGFITARLLGR